MLFFSFLLPKQQEEDPNRSIKRKFLGDSNYFDPVVLKDTGVLYPGNPEIAAVYREKVYYFSTNESREKFLEEPPLFLNKDEPLQVSSTPNCRIMGIAWSYFTKMSIIVTSVLLHHKCSLTSIEFGCMSTVHF